MTIERFSDGDVVPGYRRYRERRRLAPEGPRYPNGGSPTITTCCQLMEREAITSPEAANRVKP